MICLGDLGDLRNCSPSAVESLETVDMKDQRPRAGGLQWLAPIPVARRQKAKRDSHRVHRPSPLTPHSER